MRVFNLTLAATLVAGCGSSPPPPADPHLARSALVRALDAWKAGQAPGSLKTDKDAAYVMDFEWDRGARLIDYSLDPADEEYGVERRFAGTFTIQTNGKTGTKRWSYLVGTQKPITIRREEE